MDFWIRSMAGPESMRGTRRQRPGRAAAETAVRGFHERSSRVQ